MEIRLTPAQYSALECAGLDLPPLNDADTALLAAWRGYKLVFESQSKDALYTAVNDAANAEDGQAEDAAVDVDVRRGCRGAARALSNLASQILRF